MMDMTRRWALISGARGTRKAAVVQHVVRALAARAVTVGSVTKQTCRMDCVQGYRALRIGGDATDSVLLGGPPELLPGADAMPFCSIVFERGAFERAAAWIRRAAREADVVVIDEVSKLEVARGGYHDAICDALRGPALVLLGVRAEQLFHVMERFELGEALASLDAEDAAGIDDFAEQLARQARGGAL